MKRFLDSCVIPAAASVTEGPTTTATSVCTLRFVCSVFCFRCMHPLVRPEFLLLLLEQGDRSLEDHPRLFLLLANATSYPDDALCSFYDANLNTASTELLSEDSPREDFTTFVEWTLARNGSPLTICLMDDLARSTSDPEPSPPSPRGAEHQPEPTDDGAPFPAAINEPAQSRATEWKIAPEVEPNTSDQVREPAAVPTMREQAVDGVSAEWSSAPFTTAEGELIIHLGLLDLEEDLIDWKTDLEIELFPLLSSSPSSSVLLSSPDGASDSPVPAPRKYTLSHPFLPPPSLSSGSPSTRPQRFAPLSNVRASPTGLPSSSVARAGVSLTSASSRPQLFVDKLFVKSFILTDCHRTTGS